MSDNNNNSTTKYYAEEEPLVTRSSTKQQKKKKKPREIKYIPYSEDNVESQEGGRNSDGKHSTEAKDKEVDHFQVKLLIEERRRKFGSGWLLQNVSPSLLPASQQVEHGSSPNARVSSDSVCRVTEEDCCVSLTPKPSLVISSEPIDIQSPSVTSPGIYTSSMFSPVTTDESESEAEDDESDMFFAHEHSGEAPLMLTLGPTSFVEKDGLSGKKKHSWLLTTLLSAELLQDESDSCVVLRFDAMRRDNQERTYRMESNSSAKMFLKLLEPVLCENSIQSANEGALQCLKCDSEFSKFAVENIILQKTKETPRGEKTQEIRKVKTCPNCGSTVLVERLQKTESTSSNGSPIVTELSRSFDCSSHIGYNNTSPSMRPRSVSIVTRPNQLTPSRIFETQNEENDSTSSSSIECILPCVDDGGEKSTIRSQSDITVLSNPSQSSIAVISQTSSSISTSSYQDMSQTPTSGNYYEQNKSSRALSSPVDISQPYTSRESPWYDSSSAKTTLLHSPSPRIWDMTEENKSLSSCGSSSLPESTANRKEEESQRLWQELEQMEDVGQSAFRINHQIQLHLEVNVFENGEDFLTGINGNIVVESTKQECPGVLIVSTNSAYFFKDGNTNVDFEESEFEELERYPLKNLTDVYTLLGSQGFGLSFLLDNLGTKTVLVILRNADRCNSFVQSLEGILKNIFSKPSTSQLPRFHLLTTKILQNVHTEIIQASTELGLELDQNVSLFLLGCVQRPLESLVPVDPVAFVLTSECLYLANVTYFAQAHDAALHFQLIESQEIGNLTEVHLSDDMCSASFHFLDEDLGREDFWLFTAESKSSLSSLLIMLKSPWEEFFGIDFELAISKNCVCGL